MVEVAYDREHILDCVRRWVKPAEEVRKGMEEVMRRCTRAPETFLALRLPFKGSAMAEMEDVSTEDAGTPLHVVEDREKVKKRSSVNYVKKVLKGEVGKEKGEGKGEGGGKKGSTPPKVAQTPQAPAQGTSNEQNGTSTATDAAGGPVDAPPTTESGRPRRAVRKSVRISEG